MNKVIVFGSLNMDLTIKSDYIPKKGETIDGYGFFTNPGGKGGNQAVAAAKLGAETHMIARVGRDLFGDRILDQLREYGVQCGLVGRSESLATGVAMIICCEGDNRIILSAGANHEMKIAEVDHAIEKIAEPGDVFLTQFECDFDTTIHSLFKAKTNGMYTIFNPAPAKKIPDEAYRNIDLIVVNQTECEFLTGIYPREQEECRRAIDFFESKGVKSSIVTLGARGSVTVIEGKSHKVDSHKVETVDTTAAGDTYIGALASCLVRGEDLKESMALATKAAALTITKRGAQQSIPYLNDVYAFL